jgi:hypothetical protein
MKTYRRIEENSEDQDGKNPEKRKRNSPMLGSNFLSYSMAGRLREPAK